MTSEWYLGVETSTSHGSLALINKASPADFYEKSWSRAHSHSEVITTYAEALFLEVGIRPSQLSGIVSGCGPGSFTGIRVAMNFAKALCYANSLPLWTVDTLRAIAEEIKQPNQKILSGCEAFRDLIYSAEYICDEGLVLQEVRAPYATTAEKLNETIKSPFICGGNGISLYWQELQPIHGFLQKTNVNFPTARSIVHCITSAPHSPPPFDWKTAKPLYIRASEAEEKLKIGDLKPHKVKF